MFLQFHSIIFYLLDNQKMHIKITSIPNWLLMYQLYYKSYNLLKNYMFFKSSLNGVFVSLFPTKFII